MTRPGSEEKARLRKSSVRIELHFQIVQGPVLWNRSSESFLPTKAVVVMRGNKGAVKVSGPKLSGFPGEARSLAFNLRGTRHPATPEWLQELIVSAGYPGEFE